MIWAFVKAYWKQLLIVAMLAALAAGFRIALVNHGETQYAAGYAQAQADQKQADDKASHNVIRRKHKLNVKHNPVSMWRVLMLSMLIPLLTACAPSLTKPSDSPNTIPDLSPLARQPARSSVCSPTCLKKATEFTTQQQLRLKIIGLQENPANSNTTH